MSRHPVQESGVSGGAQPSAARSLEESLADVEYALLLKGEGWTEAERQLAARAFEAGVRVGRRLAKADASAKRTLPGSPGGGVV